MQPTHNTLSKNIGAQSVELLNKHLAAAIDLCAQATQAQWSVRRLRFIAIQEPFDEVSAEVEDYAGLIAKRVGALGGTAYGTVQVVADRSFLLSYRLGLAHEQKHVLAVSEMLAAFGQSAREAIDQVATWRCGCRSDHQNRAWCRPSIMVCRTPHNWIAGFLVIPAFAAMWFLRVPNEEAMMRARFGDAWDAYCARAGRLFPRRVS